MRAMAVSLLIAALGCAHEGGPPAPGRLADAPLRAVPLATCRNQSAWGNACFPTPSEIGGRTIDPCYDRRRGRCGGAGQRGMCYLDPIADGKPCSSGEGVCYDGRCISS